MRELFLVSSESTETSLVLRAEDGEQFFVVVDDLLRAALTGATPPPDEAPEPEPESGPEPEDAPEPVEAPVHAVSALEDRGLPTPDPRLTAPLTLRPREIQERIRSGSSITELAEEMGVLESRVEAFAHPVLLERERIAQLAKQSHPVREDGPAKLTLWEVLATAFAARGHNLADAEWDAYREPGGGPWVVRVSWTAGLSENSAEWTYHHHSTSSSTAEARNAVAADLTDPDFVQPVRTLTSVGRGARYAEDFTDDDDRYDERQEDDTADEVEEAPEDAADPDREVTGDEEEPDTRQKPPAKRRRKAVTPHWEDVLLGVRANTKRPRN